MNKAYNKITWQNKPSTATPLNQTNLNEMSNALDTIDDRVIALDSGKVSSVTVTNTLPTGDTIATITVDGTATNIKSAQVVVDSTPSATSANPLQNKAIYEMLNNLLPEETAEGNPISISDASGLNAKACSVDLLPIQDLHGYDSPWAGGAGKNKLQVTVQGYSTSGVTIAVNNGILTLSNTSTDNIQINLVTTRINVSDIGSLYKLVDDGSFTFSSNLYLNIRYYDSNGSAISNQSMNYSTKSMNLVIPNNATTFIPMVVIKSGVATNGTIKPMLMLQTETNLSFAPYSNICPISGRNSVTLTVNGEDTETEFPQTVYDGNVNVVEGGTKSKYGMVDLSTLSWSMISNERWSTTLPNAKRPQSNDYPINAVCSNNVVKSISSFVNVSTGNAIGLSSDGFLRCRNGSTTDSPTGQLCYELATPEELDTSAEQISLLKGINVLSTDGDNIILKYSADIKAWVESQLSNS